MSPHIPANGKVCSLMLCFVKKVLCKNHALQHASLFCSTYGLIFKLVWLKVLIFKSPILQTT